MADVTPCVHGSCKLIYPSTVNVVLRVCLSIKSYNAMLVMTLKRSRFFRFVVVTNQGVIDYTGMHTFAKKPK